MTDTNGNFPFEAFLDDYYAEADEHLTLIRQTLMSVESHLQETAMTPEKPMAPALINDLFRSFHTLKGLSAMVGLKTAETIAHHVENFLRILSQEKIPLTRENLSTLVQGTRMLETVIAAKREGTALPNMEASIENLREQLPLKSIDPKKDPGTGIETHETLPKTEHQQESQEEKPLWRFTFFPTQELSKKGIDVNHIRDRIEKNGRLIQATPQIAVDGKVFFEFLVATDQDSSAFEPWTKEGVRFEPYENPTKPERSETGKVALSLPGDTEKPNATEETFPESISVGPSNVVRVHLNHLDAIMQRVGDLVISRSRLENGIRALENRLPGMEYNLLQETHLAMERQLRDLREGIMRLRLVPVSDIFTRMQFVIHDLAPKYEKKVHLEMVGKDTEIDKFVVERMMDPLLHLVRNAITHGLEPETERIQKGKSPQGKITLRASTEGDAVLVEVADDGRGIDLDAVGKRAMELGLQETAAAPDMQHLLRHICSPGFSTQQEADLGSGRGVGMAVVFKAVQDLGGFLSVQTTANHGTRFRIRLPLTLAIVDALIVKSADQIFAVPQPSIREVVELNPGKVTEMENNELLPHRGGVIPLLRLSSLFGLPTMAENERVVLVVGEGTEMMGIAVDRVLSKREIVVRALDDPLVMVPGIVGATELGDGRAVMILDTVGLVYGSSGTSSITPLKQ